jgi:hypothetical protein
VDAVLSSRNGGIVLAARLAQSGRRRWPDRRPAVLPRDRAASTADAFQSEFLGPDESIWSEFASAGCGKIRRLTPSVMRGLDLA